MRVRLWGFDVGKYGHQVKSATADFFMWLGCMMLQDTDHTIVEIKKSVADLNISEACQNHGHLSATTFAVRRLLHSKPGDDPFGIHKTVKDADGNFQSALRLTNRAQAAARLGNREYKGEVCSSKMEAEVSAARVFWEELRVQERAEKLEPSKKVRKEKDAAQSAMQSAKRDGMAHARRVHRKGSESHQSPVASLTLRHFHRISVG